MIKNFIFSLFFLLGCGVLSAQPLKRNLPFNIQKTETKQEERATVSMKDFRYQSQRTSSAGLIYSMQTKPGLALLSSALVPGLGQAANNKWLRAGVYFAADVILLIAHLRTQDRAEQLHQNYKQFANNNWSVVTYAKWLVDYHQQNGISNPHIDDLEQQVQGQDPAYDPNTDWNVVDLKLLRNVERNTPYVFPEQTGNIFSHVMPGYGSQQYYELISKYYQFGPGWNNFGMNRQGESLDSIYQLAWNGSDMPPHFFQGATLADQFNDKYRIAGNMLAYMILNHVVSAFDAFITVKLNISRLEATPGIFGPQQFSLKYHF